MTTLTRTQVIARLAATFQQCVDDDHSLCEVAARRGFFCGGFAQWTFEQLKQRYDWIADKRKKIDRAGLERLANAWQLAMQQVHTVGLPCDAQAIEHHTCKGWDEFSNQDLALFLAELGGEDVEVVDDPVAAGGSAV